MPRPRLELPAPARDAAIGIEAVDHGTAAVDIGGPGFGARGRVVAHDKRVLTTESLNFARARHEADAVTAASR